jgi:DNA-binding CsgD family transcriptional regulator
MDELTGRELPVVQMLGQGRSVEEIKDRLDLGRKTVETYRRRAKEKLGFEKISELLQSAILRTYETPPKKWRIPGRRILPIDKPAKADPRIRSRAVETRTYSRDTTQTDACLAPLPDLPRGLSEAQAPTYVTVATSTLERPRRFSWPVNQRQIRICITPGRRTEWHCSPTPVSERRGRELPERDHSSRDTSAR